jgi:hypothetical protein
MSQNDCEFEPRILAALASGGLTPELLAHKRHCSICDGAAVVWECLNAAPVDDAAEDLPSADLIWWKAQIAEKRLLAERSVAIIGLIQKIAMALVALVALGCGVWFAPRFANEVPLAYWLTSLALVVLLLGTLAFLRYSELRDVAEQRWN